MPEGAAFDTSSETRQRSIEFSFVRARPLNRIQGLVPPVNGFPIVYFGIFWLRVSFLPAYSSRSRAVKFEGFEP